MFLDEEIIDVTDCSEDNERLQPAVPIRSTNLITINVSKPLSLPRAIAQMKRVKKVD